MGSKTKILSKEIELSFLFHSIRLDEQVILVYSFVKNGQVMTMLSARQSGAGYFEPQGGQFGQIF